MVSIYSGCLKNNLQRRFWWYNNVIRMCKCICYNALLLTREKLINKYQGLQIGRKIVKLKWDFNGSYTYLL